MQEPRRFYKEAMVTETADGFAVALDGKPVRTPAGAPLVFTGWQLAEAIAQEWLDQGHVIRPHTMPLMQLVSTAIDRVEPKRAEVVDDLLRYAGTDLLCYRAEGPQELIDRQEQVWQPIVEWVEALLGIELLITHGVMPIAQKRETLANLRDWLDALGAFELASVHIAATAMGSLVLAIAMTQRHMSAAEAFAASQLDETYEIELWGEDEEATRRRRGLQKDIVAADLLLKLISPEPDQEY